MSTKLDFVQLVKQTSKQVAKFVEAIETIYMYDCPVGHEIERRETNRLIITMPVTVIPLTDQLEPRIYKSAGVTRNISTAGVGLVTSDPLSGKFLLLEFEPFRSAPFSIIGKIQYCEENGFYFHVGCEFLDWDSVL